MQVASRVWVVWGIMVAAPAHIASEGITLLPLGACSIQLNLMSLLLAWSVTEIIRYSFFAFKVRLMVSLRYSSACDTADTLMVWSSALVLPHTLSILEHAAKEKCTMLRL